MEAMKRPPSEENIKKTIRIKELCRKFVRLSVKQSFYSRLSLLIEHYAHTFGNSINNVKL